MAEEWKQEEVCMCVSETETANEFISVTHSAPKLSKWLPVVFEAFLAL